MTEPITDPTGGQEPVSTLDALRSVRQARKTTPRRKTTTRRAPAKKSAPAVSRADNAAKRGKYADRIVGAIKTGAAVLKTRKPLQAQILMETAEEWGIALDRVAAEDKRVDAFLAKVSGWFGKSSAWGDLGAVAAKTGAALAMSAGMTPAGPAGVAVAFLGGALVEQGVYQVAQDHAAGILRAQGIDPDRDPERLERITQDVAATLIAEIHDKARAQPGPDDPTPTTAVPDDTPAGDPGTAWSERVA